MYKLIKAAHSALTLNRPDFAPSVHDLQAWVDKYAHLETLERTEDMPKTAQFAVTTPSGEYIQKFYRVNALGVLQYFGERGGWHASYYDSIADIKNKVYLII